MVSHGRRRLDQWDPMERGWLQWCEFSPSAVGLRGCRLHGLQDAASFKMVVPRDRISRDYALVPQARHFTKSQQYLGSTRGLTTPQFSLAQRFPGIKILTLGNDFHEEISSLVARARNR